MYGTVKQACDMGAAAVGATIYFGSIESSKEIVEVAKMFALAHEARPGHGPVVLSAESGFQERQRLPSCRPISLARRITLGVTIQADIIKQKLPENNGGYKAIQSGDSSYGKLDERIYTELTSDHPIDLCRYQLANCYMGRAGLINSGGASGAHDFSEAVTTAVINKRAGGTGLISGRKAFQRPLADGIHLLNAIQDVYLSKDITVA